MSTRVIDQNRIQQACSWTCWVLRHTDMLKAAVFRKDAHKFSVTMAALKLEVKVSPGQKLVERDARMIEKYRSECVGCFPEKRLIDESLRQLERMF